MTEHAPILRRVERDAVMLGMFIHSFEGSWLTHPFWRRRFLLDDADDLQKLHDSAVSGVFIDEARSRVPVPDRPAPAPPATRIAAAPHRAEPVRPVRALRSVLPCTVEQEIARATETVRKSRKAVMRMFGEARLGKVISAAGVAPLVDEISDSVARNPAALIGIARLKARDDYTYMHSVAVCALMINFARTLGLDEAAIPDIGMAGLLHDVGKMAVPEGVLGKPGRLTDDEFAIVRGHPERGHDLLAQSADVPDVARDVCLHHHEKIDGTGYPHRLAGDAISLPARMGAICDVYDAITSARPYKDPWTPGASIARMEEWHGHFDEGLFETFIRAIGIYPVGMLVRLRSNRLAVVVGENAKDPTRPHVRAFNSLMDRALVAPQALTVATDLRGDQIVGRARPEQWNLGDWDRLMPRIVAGAPLAELEAIRRGEG